MLSMTACFRHSLAAVCAAVNVDTELRSDMWLKARGLNLLQRELPKGLLQRCLGAGMIAGTIWSAGFTFDHLCSSKSNNRQQDSAASSEDASNLLNKALLPLVPWQVL